jgi:hypothetical protein
VGGKKQSQGGNAKKRRGRPIKFKRELCEWSEKWTPIVDSASVPKTQAELSLQELAGKIPEWGIERYTLLEIPKGHPDPLVEASASNPIAEFSGGQRSIGASLEIGGEILSRPLLSQMEGAIKAVAGGRYCDNYYTWSLPDKRTVKALNAYCAKLKRTSPSEGQTTFRDLPVEVGFWLYYVGRAVVASPLIVGKYGSLNPDFELGDIQAMGLAPLGFFHTHHRGMGWIPSLEDLLVGAPYARFMTMIGLTSHDRPLVAVFIPKNGAVREQAEFHRILDPILKTYNAQKFQGRDGMIVGYRSAGNLEFKINWGLPLGDFEQRALEILRRYYTLTVLDLENWTIGDGY